MGNRWSTRESTLEPITLEIPSIGITSVPALHAKPEEIIELLSGKHPSARWSPSLRWLYRSVIASIDIATNGYVAPTLHNDGVRWKANWSIIEHKIVEDQITNLHIRLPQVIGLKEVRDVSDFVNALTDASCRRALRNVNWKPPLPRARTSAMRGLRNTCSALTDSSGYFVTETESIDHALFDLSSQLRTERYRKETGLSLKCQGRLEPRGPEEPWDLTLEVFTSENPEEIIRWRDLSDETSQNQNTNIAAQRDAAIRFIREVTEEISSNVPGLDQLGDPSVSGVARLSLEDVSLLLLDGLEICSLIGIPILVPKGLIKQRLKLAATVTPTESGGISANLGTAMVDVDWSLALGDQSLTDEDLKMLASTKSNLVQIKGQWINIDNSQAKAALRELETRREKEIQLTPADLLKMTAELGNANDNLEFEEIPLAKDLVSADGWIEQLLEGLPDDQLTETLESEQFQGELRPYQRRALSWLQFLGRLGLGGCLADDMGLGKTPTTLAHIQSRSSSLPTLVICPLSVVHNWKAEAQIFTPDLRVLIAHGPNRPTGESLIEKSSTVDLVISTYGTTTRDIDYLKKIQWDLVVCDEAQFIKNHHTHAAAAFRQLNARQKIALTGTPVENRLSELWSILDAINPGMLGGINWFKERFATPIEQRKDLDALTGMRKLTDPFILRRTKDDKSLVPDLPDKIEQIVWSQLTHEQAGLYKAVLDDFLSRADQTEGMRRKGLILATLTKLKQVCNHPAHFLGDGNIQGNRSGKVARLDELVEEINETNQRVLVFTQYRVMGELLANHLKVVIGTQPDFLHGGITREHRQKMIDNFQQETGPPVLLISLKAGGTGLNLTAANRVIHFDRWWNPAVEDQATDRAWRIGQQSTVFVHKLVCQGTLEEKIDALLKEKKELALQSVGTGDDWFTNLGTEELREIFSLNMSMAVQQ